MSIDWPDKVEVIDELRFESFQSTLDKFRAKDCIRKDIEDILDLKFDDYDSLDPSAKEKVDEQAEHLRNLAGPLGMISDENLEQSLSNGHRRFYPSSVIGYGSVFQGKGIFPDSIVGEEFEESNPNHNFSDIDGIMLIEDVYKKSDLRRRKNEIQSWIEDNVDGSDGHFEKHYWVYTREGFLNKIRTARQGWNDGRKAEFFVVPEHARDPDKETPSKKLPRFARTLYTGFHLQHNHDTELLEEINELFKVIIDEDTIEEGIVDQDAQIEKGYLNEQYVDDDNHEPIVDIMDYHLDKRDREVTREDILEENLFLRNLRRQINETESISDTLDIENLKDFDRVDYMVGKMLENLSEEEIANLYVGTLDDTEFANNNQDLSRWAEIDEQPWNEMTDKESDQNHYDVVRYVRNVLDGDDDLETSRWSNQNSEYKRNNWGYKNQYRVGRITLDSNSNPHMPTELEYLAKAAKRIMKEKADQISSRDDYDLEEDKNPYLMTLEEILEETSKGRYEEPDQGQHQLSDF